jgi:hypothetical protein
MRSSPRACPRDFMVHNICDLLRINSLLETIMFADVDDVS